MGEPSARLIDQRQYSPGDDDKGLGDRGSRHDMAAAVIREQAPLSTSGPGLKLLRHTRRMICHLRASDEAAERHRDRESDKPVNWSRTGQEVGSFQRQRRRCQPRDG